MSQNDLNRAVARATGETVTEISRRGFQPVDTEALDRKQEPYLDWDEVDLHRNVALMDSPPRRAA